MKKVNAFQTDDGQVHATELGAIQHQHSIDLRGFFNRVAGRDALSVTEAIRLIQKNHAEFSAILTNHEKVMKRVVKKNSVVKAI
jgi:hypothetical protein